MNDLLVYVLLPAPRIWTLLVITLFISSVRSSSVSTQGGGIQSSCRREDIIVVAPSFSPAERLTGSRLGVNAHIGPNGGPLRAVWPRWSHRLKSSIQSSPCLDVYGNAYFGGSDGGLYSVASGSGNQRWSFFTSGPVTSSPALTANGIVVVGSQDHNVYGVDMNSGVPVWKAVTSDAVLASPVVSLAGVVFIPSTDGYVYALRDTDGHMLWMRLLKLGALTSSPIAYRSSLYLGTAAGALVSMNHSNGDVVWSFQTRASVSSSPAYNPVSQVVYFGSDDAHAYAVHGASGSLLWSFATKGPIRGSPAIAPNGAIVIGSLDNNVYNLDGAQGKLRWSFASGDWIVSAPAIDAEGVSFFGSYDSHLYGVDCSGHLLWSYRAGDWIASTPLVGLLQDVCFGCHDGYFRCMVDASPSPTPSLTSSASTSKSFSPSVSWTRSETRTTSATVSLTLTDSRTVTRSPSSTLSSTVTSTSTSTVSTSATSTGTASSTVSLTASSTASSTVSTTASITVTSTVSSTATSTATVTTSSSPSGSETVSTSCSGSASPSASSSRSASLSATNSSTATSSTSVSRTISGSRSVSGTAPVTSSVTSSLTVSGPATHVTSVSPTGSGHQSLSATLTRSQSLSYTTSRTSSLSVKPSISSTVTGSASTTMSATLTLTVTVSESRTFSPSGTSSRSPTESATTTKSVSLSPTMSRSQSSSATGAKTTSRSHSASISASPSKSTSRSMTTTPSPTSSVSVSASASHTVLPSGFLTYCSPACNWGCEYIEWDMGDPFLCTGPPKLRCTDEWLPVVESPFGCVPAHSILASVTIGISFSNASAISSCAQAWSVLSQTPGLEADLVSQLISINNSTAQTPSLDPTITVSAVTCTPASSINKVAYSDFLFGFNFTVSSLYGQQALQMSHQLSNTSMALDSVREFVPNVQTNDSYSLEFSAVVLQARPAVVIGIACTPRCIICDNSTSSGCLSCSSDSTLQNGTCTSDVIRVLPDRGQSAVAITLAVLSVVTCIVGLAACRIFLKRLSKQRCQVVSLSPTQRVVPTRVAPKSIASVAPEPSLGSPLGRSTRLAFVSPTQSSTRNLVTVEKNAGPGRAVEPNNQGTSELDSSHRDDDVREPSVHPLELPQPDEGRSSNNSRATHSVDSNEDPVATVLLDALATSQPSSPAPSLALAPSRRVPIRTSLPPLGPNARQVLPALPNRRSSAKSEAPKPLAPVIHRKADAVRDPNGTDGDDGGSYTLM